MRKGILVSLMVLNCGCTNMAELNKTIHIRKGSTEQTVKLYTTSAEAGSAHSHIKVDDVQAYIPLGAENDSRATLGRVKESNGNQWAILTSGKPPYHMDSYTNAGTYTWTCPSNVTQVRITVAGGGGGVATYQHYGSIKRHASGGRGAKNTANRTVSSGNTYSVIVGGGGAPIVREADLIQNSGKASDGSPSSFDDFSASGGGGGTYRSMGECTEGTSYGEGGEGGNAWDTGANAGKTGWVNVEYGGDI